MHTKVLCVSRFSIDRWSLKVWRKCQAQQNKSSYTHYSIVLKATYLFESETSDTGAYGPKFNSIFIKLRALFVSSKLDQLMTLTLNYLIEIFWALMKKKTSMKECRFCQLVSNANIFLLFHFNFFVEHKYL